MTATRVNAIFDIGIALALGVISGAVAVLVMQGCESEPEAGGCCGNQGVCLQTAPHQQATPRAGAVLEQRARSNGRGNPATCPASGLEETRILIGGRIMREIVLTQGKVALVDDADHEWLNQWKWYACQNNHTWYVQRARHKDEAPGPSRVYMHRLILSAGDGLEVDHRDGDGLNNRRDNLRLATHALNNKNCHHVSHKTSNLPMGVCCAGGRYKAQIYINGRNIHLGLFDAPEQAAVAYQAARKASIAAAETSTTLQALAPAGSKAGTCFGVEPPSVVGDGPSGLRFEEGNSGRGETRTLQGKQANASADLLAWTSTEADRYPPSVRRALDLLVAHESVGGTRMVGDGGAAQGWLQQHRGHWQDGCKRLGVSWPWPADTRDRAKCERVAVACWERFAAAYMDDVDELIRRHRLPMDPYRADNAVYLAKVKAIERSGR